MNEEFKFNSKELQYIHDSYGDFPEAKLASINQMSEDIKRLEACLKKLNYQKSIMISFNKQDTKYIGWSHTLKRLVYSGLASDSLGGFVPLIECKLALRQEAFPYLGQLYKEICVSM